jgi:hypothetical protein
VNALLFWLHETGSAAVQVCVFLYIYGPSYVIFGYAVGAVVAPRVHTQLHVPEDSLPIR